jgi:hypothetical protein
MAQTHWTRSGWLPCTKSLWRWRQCGPLKSWNNHKLQGTQIQNMAIISTTAVKTWKLTHTVSLKRNHTIWQTVTKCCAIKYQTSLTTQISLDLLIIWTDTYAATSQATFSTHDSRHNIHMPPQCLLANDDLLTHYTSGHSVTAVFKCTSMLSLFTAEIWHTFHFSCSVSTLLRHCINVCVLPTLTSTSW